MYDFVNKHVYKIDFIRHMSTNMYNTLTFVNKTADTSVCLRSIYDI